MTIGLDFTESEAKILLESLMSQERQLLELSETSDDEDAVADAGNDLIELRLLLNRMRDTAVAKFGKRVIEFTKTPL
ncbi:MAG TPA: hypothetical protein VFH68_19810 [Polyangia bacterium]|nr:hypothetical protein [Polyangia bacterium]